MPPLTKGLLVSSEERSISYELAEGARTYALPTYSYAASLIIDVPLPSGKMTAPQSSNVQTGLRGSLLLPEDCSSDGDDLG